MVPLDHGDVAVGPSTLQIKVVCALATDVDFAHVVIEGFGTLGPLAAALPEALEGVIAVAIGVAAIGEIRVLLLQLR